MPATCAICVRLGGRSDQDEQRRLTNAVRITTMPTVYPRQARRTSRGAKPTHRAKRAVTLSRFQPRMATSQEVVVNRAPIRSSFVVYRDGRTQSCRIGRELRQLWNVQSCRGPLGFCFEVLGQSWCSRGMIGMNRDWIVFSWGHIITIRHVVTHFTLGMLSPTQSPFLAVLQMETETEWGRCDRFFLHVECTIFPEIWESPIWNSLTLPCSRYKLNLWAVLSVSPKKRTVFETF